MKLWQKKTIDLILKKNGKKIKKGLGQNYLIDHNILLKIAKMVQTYPRDHSIVEIGPGLGGLTQTLLEENTHPLLAVEIDSLSCTILQDVFFKQNCFPDDWQQRLQLFNRDIRDFDVEQYAQPPFVFIGNLPYNVATSIIIEILERYKGKMAGGIFMIQKEVAERFICRLDEHDYSLITVIASASANIDKIVHVPPQSFYPPPKVDSALIHITPHQKDFFDSPHHYLVFKIITKAAFRHRRKQISNSIKLSLMQSETLLKSIDRKKQDFTLNFNKVEKVLRQYPSKRAEELSPQDYIEIARTILH